jgi:hypothetical protein
MAAPDLQEEKPHRVPWDGFPDVAILADQTSVKAHEQYENAKAGAVDVATPAAKRLAAHFLSEIPLARAAAVARSGSVLLPIHAREGQGFNRIPAAFAELLAEKLELSLEEEVVQTNVVNHTGATGWRRLATPPLFGGAVRAGTSYVLIDDFVGQGGTLANLRGHVIRQGGLVLGAITLTGRADSAKLALEAVTLEALRSKHGQDIENWWRDNFGFGFESLTESEAKYLLRVEDADTIRNRILEARSEDDH